MKFDNAQAAGAVAAVIYDNVANEALVLMGVGHATLPAAMISNADGLNLKGLIAGIRRRRRFSSTSRPM